MKFHTAFPHLQLQRPLYQRPICACAPFFLENINFQAAEAQVSKSASCNRDAPRSHPYTNLQVDLFTSQRVINGKLPLIQPLPGYLKNAAPVCFVRFITSIHSDLECD